MTDESLHADIEAMSHEEHALLAARGRGEITEDQLARLRELEVALDRCWDLLRQREARRNAGLNPDDAQERSAGTVEDYLQ